MKPKSCGGFRAPLVVLFTLSLTASMHAGTTWDGGGGTGNTNINEPTNWDADTLPDLTGPATVTFPSANGTATVNADVQFVRTAFSNSFTLAEGAGSLTYRGTSSGSNAYGIQATSGAANVQINEPVLVKAVPSASPLGNLFLIYNNRTTSNTTTLSINGGIALAPGSTASNYILRYGTNTASSANTSDTRIAGTISGLGTLQNSSSGGNWAGDLIIAGDQTLSTSDISISGGTSFQTPAATARLVLGETPDDVQSWRAVSLGNFMNVVAKGSISATTCAIGSASTIATVTIPGGSLSLSGAISTGATVGNKIIGGATTNGTLKLTSGTINGTSTTIGGTGTDENNLNLTKLGSGTLTLSGGTHTYTGNTTVEAGTLNLAGCTLASNVTVQAGATLSGEGTTTGTLAFSSGISTLSFDPATTASLTANAVDVSAADAWVVVNPSAATTVGQSYTVLTKTSDSFAAEDLAKFGLSSRGGSLSIGGATNNEIILTAAATTPATLIWEGADTTHPTYWDLATTQNWSNGGPDRFYNGDAVTFDDSASSYTVAVQGSLISPGNLVFNHTTAYTFSGGTIGGTGSLSKSGTGTLTLGNALSLTGGISVHEGILNLGTTNNSFTGGVVINGGELKFSGEALPSSGSLNSQAVALNGGMITRSSNSVITNDSQSFTVDANGGTIKVDSNANVTWRIGGKISGSGNWSKSGNGVLAIGRTANSGAANDFSGTLTVTAGTLDIRHANSLGTTDGGTSIQGATLLMQNYGQTTGSTIAVAEPLDFSGNAFLSGYCQEGKTFTQQFTGPVSIAAGAVLGISTARNSSGATAPLLEINGSTITTSTDCVLAFGLRPTSYPAGSYAAAQTVNVGSTITGPAAVTAQGDAGSVYTLSAPEYSGNTTVNSGTLKLGAANQNNDSSTVTIATGGKIDIAFSGDDTVASLVLGGTPVGPGSYNASHPTYGGFFSATGTGSIVVPGATGGYSAWQSTNAPGQTVDQDHDNDGVKNGIEYFMGQSGNGFTATPVLNAANLISWTMGDSYSGSYGTDYLIQTSSDLATWNSVPVGEVTIDDTAPGKSVSFTLTGAGKRFVRLLVNPN